MCDAKDMAPGQYVRGQMRRSVKERSNGESALKYFTDHIDSDALYLLDEPENSLSAELQLELKAVYRIFSTLLSLSVYHVHPFSVSFVHSACNSLRLGH